MNRTGPTAARRASDLLAVIGAGIAVLAAPAQPAAAQAQPRGEPTVSGGRTTLDVHSESTSRELFSACDRDSDDRLDLFEACEALETLGDPEDSGSFLALDHTRDGYLQWPEFDAHYRRAIERNGRFRVKTCRRFVQHAPELKTARAATPLEIFLQLNDANENGGLDPDEIARLVRDIGLPPAFENQLKMLDLDQSGRVEAVELAPVFDQIRSFTVLPGMAEIQPTPRSELPPPFCDIDRSGDGTIDESELADALRKLDASLTRWAPEILKNLDTDGDRQLAGSEIPGAAAAPPKSETKPDTGTDADGSKSSESTSSVAPRTAAGLLGALRGGQ